MKNKTEQNTKATKFIPAMGSLSGCVFPEVEMTKLSVGREKERKKRY